MRGLFLAVSALILVGISSEAYGQVQQVKPATGRFYCQGVFNWDLRMDVDFFGRSASLDIYNVKNGQTTRRRGSFDEFRSNVLTTRYQVSPFAEIDFPADYQIKHWFQLTYSDSYGWIRFDCNHF